MISIQSGAILLLWMALSNISLSCVFPVVLLLTGDKSNSAEQTRNLSTMMQSVGYAMSAFGPYIMGQIFQVTDSWNVAMVAMSSLALFQLFAGLIAARPGKIAY
jgi:CP family cyanate transporter-like MFS transporter